MRLLRFIWEHLGASRRGFSVAMGASVTEGALVAFQALVIGVALVRLAGGATTGEILPWCAAFLFAFAGRLIATRIAWLQGFKAGNAAVETIRNRIVEHMRATPLGTYHRWSAAKLACIVSEDGRWITETATFTLNRIVAGLSAAVVLMALALWFSPAAALVVLGVFALTALVAPIANRVASALLARRSDHLVLLARRIGEYAEGIAVFRSFRRTGAALDQLRAAVTSLRDLMIAATPKLVPLQELAAGIFSLGVPVAIAFLAMGWLPAGQTEAARLIPVLFLVLAAREAMVNSVLHQALIVRLGLLAHDRIAAFLHEPILTGTAQEFGANASIQIEGLSFRYAPEKPDALHGINLVARAGCLTAVVGPSGAGKSTLTALLMRFFDPDCGKIRIGGTDIARLDPAVLMARISLVSQDVHLFRDTLRANLLLGAPGADEARLREVIRAARLDAVVASLPEGLDTLIGEGGKTLSGGERQRVAIARAILKDAPIVILDEATSAMDPLNESAIQQALAALMPGRTMIVIAHRLGTIAHADRIHVMEAGRIVESGRHDDLLALGGLYARLWNAQAQATGWRLRA
jgi:ATP-binding cassette subfamily B protein IrtB